MECCTQANVALSVFGMPNHQSLGSKPSLANESMDPLDFLFLTSRPIGSSSSKTVPCPKFASFYPGPPTAVREIAAGSSTDQLRTSLKQNVINALIAEQEFSVALAERFRVCPSEALCRLVQPLPSFIHRAL